MKLKSLLPIILLFILPASGWAQPYSAQITRYGNQFHLITGSAPYTCNAITEGRGYYDTTAHSLYFCNGTAWTAAGGNSGSGANGQVVLWTGANTQGGDADLTFSVDTLTATKIVGSTSITDSGLTATRCTFAGTAGLLSDDADCTFVTDTLTVTKLVAVTNVKLPDTGFNFTSATNTGISFSGGAFVFTRAGTSEYVTGSEGWRLKSTLGVSFSSGDPTASAADANISRVSPGVVGVGTGAAGSVAGTISSSGVISAGTINHSAGDYNIYRTITAGGTTGAQTINKLAGTVNFAAAATSIVVTNSLVTTSSLVYTVMRTADTTCTFVKSVVPAAGSFTITVNAGCNAETSVGFLVTN